MVLPFLLNLAITGGLYLFTPEINHVLYRSLENVPVRAAPMPASLLVKKAGDITKGDILRLTLPAEPDKSVEMLVRTAREKTARLSSILTMAIAGLIYPLGRSFDARWAHA